MDFEEEYMDVLQNLESMIVMVYRREPDLVDYDVEAALSGLISHYQAELRGREARLRRLNERAQDVYDNVHAMCEWRLGREVLESKDGGAQIALPSPNTLDEIIACLKRIRKSVRTWSKRGGRQGYLEFVKQFLP